MRFSRRFLILGLSAGAMLSSMVPAHATPYASNVTKVGTSVSLILNEPTDTLKYSINGGALIALDGTTKGTKTFNLGLPTDTFSIVAEKNALTGYTIPTGGTIPTTDSGSLAIATPASGLSLISDDASTFSIYNSPRGVDVSKNPNAPNFGTVYIANSQVGTTLAVPDGPGVRSLNEGIYALHADQSDAYGYGDTAQNPILPDTFPAFPIGAGANSPYHVTVSSSGDVYVADFFDSNSNAFVFNPALTSGNLLFQGVAGAFPLPAGQNHGSVESIHVEGSLATNDLVVYTMDEDLTTAQVAGSGSATDRDSLWRYNIGGGPVPVNTMPTKVADGFPALPTFPDMTRGADGKFYLSGNPGGTAGTRLFVVDANGAPLWNSLDASIAMGNATDILLNMNQIAISPDQKYLAGMLNFSDVLVLPLINGIPDLAHRLVVDAGNVNSGRDISFDAANNIHLVSSGQQLYRVLSPGGHTITTLTWNGSSYSFNLQNVVGIPGDYDNSGAVDADDYVLWRKYEGTTHALPNDSIGGTIGAAQYTQWRTHFGQPPGSGASAGANAAVPEPATLVLMAFAASGWCFWRRRAA